MQTDALAGYLRGRREKIDPTDVGLAPTGRRRTAGLRREEVAHLAGMSVDYYVRLEQGRSAQPLPRMLRSLARALRLGDDETDHLHRLAGHAVPDRGGVSFHVRPTLMFILDQVSDAAAFVTTDTEIVLAQNALATLLMGELLDPDQGWKSSLCWRWFTEPGSRELLSPKSTTRTRAFA